MAITPDTKDWTWVLDRPCPECGFDARTFEREGMGASIRDLATEWERILADPRSPERPSDDAWSALEYGAHVRDVFALYSERLHLMLTTDDPLYPNWDQDAAAIEKDYASEDAAVVAEGLWVAATELADAFDKVAGDAWERTGRRSDGASFTLESFACYLIHDPIHHVHDARKGFNQISSK